jgi:hypothetical protein
MTTLHQRLLEVRKSITSIQKDERNQYHKFNYASSSAVLKALRDAMDSNGVLLIPSVTGRETGELTTQDDKKNILTHLDITYRWVNVDNPEETIECSWYAQGIDAGERGVGKALTYAEKYFLLRFFNVPTDDLDPDAGRRDPHGGSGGNKNNRQQQTRNNPSGPMTAEQRKSIWSLAKKLWGEKGALKGLGDLLQTDRPDEVLKKMSRQDAASQIQVLTTLATGDPRTSQ